MTEENLQRLERLARLKEQGSLSEAEFSKQKADLMGTGPRQTPPKKKLTIGRVILYAFLGMMVLGFIGILAETPPSPQTLEQKAFADSLSVVEAQNKKWGTDIATGRYFVKNLVKTNLKEPDSYDEIEHKELIISKKNLYIQCQLKYRAKNSFGGYNIETVFVNFDRDMKAVKTWTE